MTMANKLEVVYKRNIRNIQKYDPEYRKWGCITGTIKVTCSTWTRLSQRVVPFLIVAMVISLSGGLLFGYTIDHVTICVLGIVVSLYALYVEIRKERDPTYVAACDFNENMKCSRVLTSEYSQGFGLVQYIVSRNSYLNPRNCNVGMVFFILQMAIGLSPVSWGPAVLFYTSLGSCLGCLYLAYILFFILRDICVVCLSIYVVNFALTYVNYIRYVEFYSNML